MVTWVLVIFIGAVPYGYTGFESKMACEYGAREWNAGRWDKKATLCIPVQHKSMNEKFTPSWIWEE